MSFVEYLFHLNFLLEIFELLKNQFCHIVVEGRELVHGHLFPGIRFLLVKKIDKCCWFLDINGLFV